MLPSSFFDMGQKVHSQISKSHSFGHIPLDKSTHQFFIAGQFFFLSVNKTIFDHFDGLTLQLLVEPNFFGPGVGRCERLRCW